MIWATCEFLFCTSMCPIRTSLCKLQMASTTWHGVTVGGCAQVRFFEVSEAELETQRELFRTGRLQIKIEEVEFSMKCAPWLQAFLAW